MKILAIETATEACSAALEIDNECQMRFEIAPRKHTELILPMVDELLSEADIKIQELDAIAFGQGPGAFTGVRVAIGVVQGLAFAHDLPVIPVSTLAALAQQYADRYDTIATAIDARMQEIYWGIYKKDNEGLMQACIDETVCAPDMVNALSDEQLFGVGTGWGSYTEALQARLNDKLIGFDADALPTAKEIITLAKPIYETGNLIAAEQAMPVYLRNKVVNK